MKRLTYQTQTDANHLDRLVLQESLLDEEQERVGEHPQPAQLPFWQSLDKHEQVVCCSLFVLPICLPSVHLTL